MAYVLMNRVILSNRYTKERKEKMCNTYYAAGQLTDEEYTELMGKIAELQK